MKDWEEALYGVATVRRLNLLLRLWVFVQQLELGSDIPRRSPADLTHRASSECEPQALRWLRVGSVRQESHVSGLHERRPLGCPVRSPTPPHALAPRLDGVSMRAVPGGARRQTPSRATAGLGTKTAPFLPRLPTGTRGWASPALAHEKERITT